MSIRAKRKTNRAPARRRIRRRRKVYRKRIHPLQEWPRPDEFIRRFRLPPDVVRDLSQKFENSSAYPYKGLSNGGGLSAEDRVCLALRYMATGASYQLIGDSQGVSKTTVKRCIHSFIEFLVTHKKEYIHFPVGQELHETALRFAEKHKFDQVVGLVDGSYAPIKRPPRNEGAYVCRHGYHALNCLFVCDAEQRITFVEPGMAGANHDMAVWENSDFGCRVTDTNILGDYFLLGDGGCLSKHGSGCIMMDPYDAALLVIACCVLHNIRIDCGLSKLSRKNNQDPQLEDRIQREAQRRFRLQNNRISADDMPSNPRPCKRTSHYVAGLRRRTEVIHKQFGGPDPRQEEKNRKRIAQQQRRRAQDN